jgi:hypothetical protein
MEAGLPGLSPTHRGGVHCVSQAVRDPYCQRYRWPSVEQQHRHPDIQDTRRISVQSAPPHPRRGGAGTDWWVGC